MRFIFIYRRKADGSLFPVAGEGIFLHAADYEFVAKYQVGKYVSRLPLSKIKNGKTRYLYDNSGTCLVYAEVYGTGRTQRVERRCSPQEWLDFMKQAKRVGDK